MPLFTYPILPQALYDGEPTNNATTSATQAGNVYLVSCTLQTPAILTAIRMRFNTVGGTGHFDLGIYDATGTNGLPNNLLAHAASSATALSSTAASQNPAFIGGNLALSPGRYWLAFWVDNTTDTFNKQTSTNANMSPILVGTYATGPLPTLASSISSLTNGTIKPLLIGLLSGGWS